MAWAGGVTWPISVYLIILALITFVATMAASETAGKHFATRINDSIHCDLSQFTGCAVSLFCGLIAI
jgi:hypothetical protein